MIDLIEARHVAHVHRRAGAEYGEPYESVVANQERRPRTNGLEWLVGRGCFGVVCHSVAAVTRVSGVRCRVSGAMLAVAALTVNATCCAVSEIR